MSWCLFSFQIKRFSEAFFTNEFSKQAIVACYEPRSVCFRYEVHFSVLYPAYQIEVWFIGGSLVSHLSGRFWLFAPKFWEMAETYKWWFCSKMNAAWVVGTITDSGDTQTLLAFKKKLYFCHSQMAGMQKVWAQALAPRREPSCWHPRSHLVELPLLDIYHPQLSCGKVMFSQVSVILFTGGGVWQTPPSPVRHPLGQTPLPKQTPPWTDTPGQRSPGRHPPQADTPPRQTPPLGRHPPAQCMLGYTPPPCPAH